MHKLKVAAVALFALGITLGIGQFFYQRAPRFGYVGPQEKKLCMARLAEDCGYCPEGREYPVCGYLPPTYGYPFDSSERLTERQLVNFLIFVIPPTLLLGVVRLKERPSRSKSSKKAAA